MVLHTHIPREATAEGSQSELSMGNLETVRSCLKINKVWESSWGQSAGFSLQDIIRKYKSALSSLSLRSHGKNLIWVYVFFQVQNCFLHRNHNLISACGLPQTKNLCFTTQQAQWVRPRGGYGTVSQKLLATFPVFHTTWIPGS